jgi:hypothetical protein
VADNGYDSGAMSRPAWTNIALCSLILLILGLWPANAHAADPVAEALFQDAITLMKASNFAEACPKLAASHAREAKSGTLLVLGSCHEQLGKTATAWAEYTEAATLARTEGRPENAEKAKQFADAVAPNMSRLTLVVPQPVSGLAVTLDGEAVATATFGTALPLDPGPHRVVAEAPGFDAWSQEVTIGGNADAQTVQVPALTPMAVSPEPEPAVAPVMVPAPAPVMQPPAPPMPMPDDGEQSTPTWVWVVGGTGLALLAASIAFRVDQSAAASNLDEQCGETRVACPPGYDFMADRSRETRDFGLFLGFGGAGLVAVGAAVVGLF